MGGEAEATLGPHKYVPGISYVRLITKIRTVIIFNKFKSKRLGHKEFQHKFIKYLLFINKKNYKNYKRNANDEVAFSLEIVGSVWLKFNGKFGSTFILLCNLVFIVGIVENSVLQWQTVVNSNINNNAILNGIKY